MGAPLHLTLKGMQDIVFRSNIWMIGKLVVTLQPKGCETAHARQLMHASLLSLNRSFGTRIFTQIRIYHGNSSITGSRREFGFKGKERMQDACGRSISEGT